ncbi:uncharacterized protein NPIL_187921 [Nephila pilipes]|uniref:Uncharacterized protein n=1 Tax=Nephila pilipes TaxID=299642 RepID=A0A8X6QL91_NEPPI|nr:uncharacterized protein NPIL_187921 [Nephila pilipes]
MFENPDWWRCDDPVEFTEASGLGKDAYGILQRFTRGDLVWFHLMVKHDAFETFCKEMGKIWGQFALLPFWCLCDGMVSGTGRTQHRHMIVACELESSFKDIWQYKICYDFPNSGRAKKCVKIQDAFHLARAIVNVSQRNAGCDVTGWKFINCVDSLGPTIPADRRAHCSVFDITLRSKTVFEKGKCGAGRELVISTHPGRTLCVVPKTTKCHESNQGDENGTGSCLEMQSGRRKGRKRRVEDGKRRAENGKRHVENQRNRVENGKRRDQNGAGHDQNRTRRDQNGMVC